jgi:hypothetical protein
MIIQNSLITIKINNILLQDKNGKAIQGLDFPAFRALWQDYFHSPDKKSKGNWLFGPLDGITDCEEEKK